MRFMETMPKEYLIWGWGKGGGETPSCLRISPSIISYHRCQQSGEKEKTFFSDQTSELPGQDPGTRLIPHDYRGFFCKP